MRGKGNEGEGRKRGVRGKGEEEEWGGGEGGGRRERDEERTFSTLKVTKKHQKRDRIHLLLE